MSVRAVWVISSREEGTSEYSVVYSRRFPTVERQARLACLKHGLYHALPSDRDMCKELVRACTDPQMLYGYETGPINWPVIELFNGHLWPVVCLKQDKVMYVAVVSFVPDNGSRPTVVKLAGVPAALSLLGGMADLLGSATLVSDKTSTLSELHQFVCLSAPFGTPVDTNPANVKLQFQFWKANTMPKEKVPAWRPAVYKGSSRLQVHIREEIMAVQYDRDDIDDVWNVYGSVSAKAEMDGHPDILLSLTTPSENTHLDYLTVHSSVQSADSIPYVDVLSPGGVAQIRKLRFSGIMESFTLCSYQASVPLIPIRGFYQMKGDRIVELLVQLKLFDSVRNSFEYCEVHLPFFNRGPIDHVDNVVPVSSSVVITPNRRKLVWSVPQRFPTKTLEVSLRATVVFPERDMDQTAVEENDKEEEEDDGLWNKFCVDQNAFCEVHFKISDYTLSGCSVDHNSITTFPPVKHKTILTRELVASHYRIWNSHGDVLCFPSTNAVESTSSN